MIVAEFAFYSEPLESQYNLPMPPYFPPTKMEMIQKQIVFVNFDGLVTISLSGRYPAESRGFTPVRAE